MTPTQTSLKHQSFCLFPLEDVLNSTAPTTSTELALVKETNQEIARHRELARQAGFTKTPVPLEDETAAVVRSACPIVLNSDELDAISYACHSVLTHGTDEWDKYPQVSLHPNTLEIIVAALRTGWFSNLQLWIERTDAGDNIYVIGFVKTGEATSASRRFSGLEDADYTAYLLDISGPSYRSLVDLCSVKEYDDSEHNRRLNEQADAVAERRGREQRTRDLWGYAFFAMLTGYIGSAVAAVVTGNMFFCVSFVAFLIGTLMTYIMID